ncbi:MAG: hypothetical protein GY893_10585 [bacterium]|nr:hypothetical protein [bacterium]
MNHEAIYKTHPTVVRIDDSTGAFDAAGNKVTLDQSAVDTEVARLQTVQNNTAYARARADAYPSVADFMEAYTEKEIGSSSTKWDAYVTAYNKVRSDNPKP